jgi:FkbM family methyltransferase
MAKDNFKKYSSYIKDGTFQKRIQKRWENLAKERERKKQEKVVTQRLTTWNAFFANQDIKSMEYEIQRDAWMKLYPDDWLSNIIYCGYFELDERAFLNKFLRKGDVFIDIGANIGLYSIIAARRVGDTGRVYSFEPCTKTYNRLQANVQLNKYSNVICEKYAVSDKQQNQEMNVSLDHHDAWNSLTRPTSGNHFTSEMVHSLRLDDYTRDQQLIGRVRMIKIDVEGWEAHVLSGGMDYFSRQDAPLLQVEFNDDALEAAGTSCKELYDLLESFGYQMFLYSAKKNKLIKESGKERDRYDGANLIATKNPVY